MEKRGKIWDALMSRFGDVMTKFGSGTLKMINSLIMCPTFFFYIAAAKVDKLLQATTGVPSNAGADVSIIESAKGLK